MSTILYRLGRLAYRRRKTVAALWLALLVAMGAAAATLAEETTDSFEIPGSESVEALELLNERFPEAAPQGASARVVFAAPAGQTLTDPANQAAVQATVEELAQIDVVVGVADPFTAGTISPDGRIGFADVSFDVSLPAANEELEQAVAPARAAGLTVEMSGDALMEEFQQNVAELIGLGVAAIVLVITFGSFVAAGMPLLNAIIGIGITISAVTAVTAWVNLSSFTPTLAVMLGLALAIDYSLFIVSRYRHELTLLRQQGEQGRAAGAEAMGRALGTAGSAVVFAGLTVLVALIGLSVVRLPLLTEMGITAGFAVALAVVIALTMLPALCGMVGDRIVGRRAAKAPTPPAEAESARSTLGTRWIRFITRRPAPVLLVIGVGMLALAAPAAGLRLGLPDDSALSESTTQRRAYDLISEGFGPGFNGPLLLVVDAAGGADTQAVAEQVHQQVAALPGVVMAHPPAVNPAGDTALLTVIPETGPSAEETEELVERIREHTAALEQSGAEISVSGMTAIIIDFNQKMADALPPYLALVVGLSFVLLILVFRSVLVPLKAALGFLLSMGATFGAVVAVFQWGWLDFLGINSSGLVFSFLPIVLIGVVFGLAMDYQVFLVTRMREEYVRGAAPIPAVVTGFQHGVRVVTAAAVIMISVFAGFTISGDDFILQIALALAVAIALDAFVVRMTLVPAALALLGRSAWWIPRWLDRIVPSVDVEGEKLRAQLDRSDQLVTAGSR
ncbi:MAG TPA: MMPL family transporter [Natronosporangium sp.]|nr:MMPL family transporter [Natronosporangium sp.]